MSTATLNVEQAASFWRVARRLHSIYSELDTTYELGMPPCSELQSANDPPGPQAMERVRQWFDQMDTHIQVWQLRQLLQSTTLQNEENLRYLIVRHLQRRHKTEADKDKLDFLLVQYFAHCAPHGISEQQLTLDEVARVLEPVLGPCPTRYPDWAASLDEKLQRLNGCNSLEDLQNTGALLDVRELKVSVGDHYFEPGLLVAFTRFNFRARRAFFKAMHFDLHAIREAVNELEQLGCTSVDCREAGLTENESLDQVRHVVHQWKTPFRAPYSGGSSFLQLVQLRMILQLELKQARAAAGDRPAVQNTKQDGQNRVVQEAVEQAVRAIAAQNSHVADRAEHAAKPVNSQKGPAPDAKGHQASTPAMKPQSSAGPAAAPDLPHSDPLLMQAGEQPDTPVQAAPPAKSQPEIIVSRVPERIPEQAGSEDDDYLQRCVADITEQLAAAPPRHSPAVCAITLAGCKLLIATWEADAFVKAADDFGLALQRAVAARTILYVCMERHRKGEPTDVTVALDLAREQVTAMEKQVVAAKESNNIDAAVNLAATAKRLLALIDEAQKVSA
jgi:hypothetical protein